MKYIINKYLKKVLDPSFVISIIINELRLKTGFTGKKSSIILLALSSSEILTNYVLFPDRNYKMYAKFLDMMGKDIHVHDVNSLKDNQHICSIMHKDSCIVYLVRYNVQTFLKSLNIYFYLYSTLSIISAYGNIFKINKKNIIKQTLQSSLFLSLYCTLAKSVLCMRKQCRIYGKPSELYLRSSLILPALALFVEKDNRFYSLSTYVFVFSIMSRLKIFTLPIILRIFIISIFIKKKLMSVCTI